MPSLARSPEPLQPNWNFAASFVIMLAMTRRDDARSDGANFP
jgi:hypothetical protein